MAGCPGAGASMEMVMLPIVTILNHLCHLAVRYIQINALQSIDEVVLINSME